MGTGLSRAFLCSHDFIGEFTTSYRELARGQSQFNIYEVRQTPKVWVCSVLHSSQPSGPQGACAGRGFCGFSCGVGVIVSSHS